MILPCNILITHKTTPTNPAWNKHVWKLTVLLRIITKLTYSLFSHKTEMRSHKLLSLFFYLQASDHIMTDIY